MRIALVAPSRSDPAHRRVLASLRERLVALGDEVSVFPPERGPVPREPRLALERLLRERGIQICHVQYFSRGFGWLARLRRPPGTRLVLTHQGASFELMERPAAFRRLARRADVLTSVSRAGLGELRAFFAGTRAVFRHIPNGTDLGPGRGRPRAIPRKCRLGGLGRGPFILSVGRLSAYKGTDILLMAFARLAAEEPGLELAVCGPDQAGGRLARFAARLGLGRRVRFLGDTRPARVRELLARCLFFVLPSRRENMPMALLEAMAAGKAVIASDVGGVAEAMRHRVEGLLVEPEDVPALAGAMRRLARDARLRTRLGRAARLRARLYDWSLVALSYRRLYARVLSAG